MPQCKMDHCPCRCCRKRRSNRDRPQRRRRPPKERPAVRHGRGPGRQVKRMAAVRAKRRRGE